MPHALKNGWSSVTLVLLLTTCGAGHAEVLTISTGAEAIAITGGYCVKNISVKYQVPVTRTRTLRHVTNAGEDQLIHPATKDVQHSTTSAPPPLTTGVVTVYSENGGNCNYDNNNGKDPHNRVHYTTEEYVTFEDRVRWDTVHVCCPGYRSLLLGFCAPVCTQQCPRFSYCTAPEQCECLHGYEPSHHTNKQRQLNCRPVCVGGCPEHSHCVARNRCECRPGYKAVSRWWFETLRCERIHCPASDQRYDATQRACVKIEMSMEELMQRVAEKLSRGFNLTSIANDDDDDDEIEMDSSSVDGSNVDDVQMVASN